MADDLRVLVRQLQSRFPQGTGTPPTPAMDDAALGTEWTDLASGEKYLKVAAGAAGWKQITHA
jgi:hypothetical protein